MFAFDVSLLVELTHFLIIDCKALNFHCWGLTTNHCMGYNYQPLGYIYNYQITGYHWGITTSLVVIPQPDPLNPPARTSWDTI